MTTEDPIPDPEGPDSWEVTLVRDDVIHTIDGVTGWTFEALPGSLSLDTEAGARVFITVASWSVISIEPIHESQVETESIDDSHEAFQESGEWFDVYENWVIDGVEKTYPWRFNDSAAYADAYENWKAAQ